MESSTDPQSGSPDAPDKEKMEQVSFYAGASRLTITNDHLTADPEKTP